ncbi:ABC-three component system middle component 6 [Clostridium botulinum]|uniref:Uncharacterized protein n=1 Tax=Clostridium botulinum (strain Langeland / NCTC 10281 / Type F) TaxID=441772 RepID=A7GEF3_CLOBL|nr:ABC-three component system middle component 6 [Clostridium botulinum]ABS40017.1 hypothetical protein CLI_1905 [Clostridium botulinum F str. Langeland]ADF99581.1 hypothetical protein CBF_1886 [Clostridium botulinum F str. 230613]KKM42841.1 hypothetical protein VT72_04160 [Clostridium botulinum]MBY6791639.1 hypothetical protein [Clostridium botulinum]MBY6936875.1 hypothetical protein [Clostridium botulinum]
MKIRPNKHTDISKSLLKNTIYLIDILLEQDFIQFNELYLKYKMRNGNASFKNFILAIELLFCLDRIKYNKKNDLIRLCNYEVK